MKRSPSTFYCFSPPVMIATFAIEIALALYALWRYKLTTSGRLVVAILVLLATFQLAEYNVCEGWAGDPLAWSRVGFAAITFLPALGLHLTSTIIGLRQQWPVAAAYGAAVVFAAFFLLVRPAFEGSVCLGNYVIFDLLPGSGLLFSVYYYGLLFAALGLGAYHLHRRTLAARPRKALLALLAGYLAFMVPVTVVNAVNPDTVRGIPSIMCGFAVLLAVVLAAFVLPVVGEKRKGAKR